MAFLQSTCRAVFFQRLLNRSICNNFGVKRSFHSSLAVNARIMCCDEVEKICSDILIENGHEADNVGKLPKEELFAQIGEYDGLIVRSATTVTDELMSKAPKLKLIGRAGVGVDNIDIQAATERGILVMNTPGGNTVSAAELTFAHLMSLVRNVPQADFSMKDGKWEKKKFIGKELAGKTLGVVGLGRIGFQVAKWGTEFRMKVIAYDPMVSFAAAREAGLEKVSLEDIFAGSDFITLHTPLTPETRNLISDETLSRCKDGVYIINCARGGVVDEAALLRGLESGKVGGAALDVFSEEPPNEAARELLKDPRVLCTPHLGASTDEAQEKVARSIAQQFVDALAGREYFGVVNAPHIELVYNPDNQKFLKLGEKIGALIAQIVTPPLNALRITCHGSQLATAKGEDLTRIAVLKGALPHIVRDREVNIINAPSLAKEMGLTITTQSSLMPLNNPKLMSYANLVTVEAVGSDGVSRSASAALLGENEWRIVQMDKWPDFPSFTPSGHVLFFQNEDRPGAMGGVVDVLSRSQINVAYVGIARQPLPDGSRPALSFFLVDDPIPPAVLHEIDELPHIYNVRMAYIAE